ncbi:hypothetical protein V1504DRAFT_30938 [Lipomyces starkeyi]
MKSCPGLVALISCFCILGLRVGAAADHHCHSCGGVSTPSTSVLDFEHITPVTGSIAPLPTGFHYPDYLYLSDFQLLKCSAFAPTSADAKACSSGNLALLSNGSGTMIFGTPDSTSYSNYKYLNLSSMLLTWKTQTFTYQLRLLMQLLMVVTRITFYPITSKFLKEVPTY